MVITASDAPAKRLSVLGSTGSVGKNTLKVIEETAEPYVLHALTAHSNVALLAEQAILFRAHMAVITDDALYPELKDRLHGTGIRTASGTDALIEAAAGNNDIVMAAIMGAAGLAPVLAAIRTGATIALANKECLVCGGELMMQEAAKYNARILPVDSEHNAIFQVFDTTQPEQIHSITLTASGGPFRNFTLAQMQQVTPEQAINHPRWKMGAKISVDSATMMNKGLELIEAFHLFPLSAEQIEIIVHPESVIHGMVTYRDGSVLAQMASPDMRIPIAYALNWPARTAITTSPLNLASLGSLTFQQPDPHLFPAPALARHALTSGGSAPIILNAANEVAVQHFLEHKIGFLDIIALVTEALATIPHPPLTHIDAILPIDQHARIATEKLAKKFIVNFVA
jgi:1-deoxy-D-xylulose-5-phosphate reductoisomerase